MSYSGQHGQGSLLARLRPADLLTNTLFANGALRVEITLILATVVPGTAGTADVDIYHNDAAATFDADSVIKSARLSYADDSVIFQAPHPGAGIFVQPGGFLGVKLSIINTINVSVYGVTETRADRVRGL